MSETEPTSTDARSARYNCVVERNWSGNVVYSAGHIERPTSLEELRAVVRRSAQVRWLRTACG